MEEERICRRCLLKESGREEVLADILARIDRLAPAERTDPAEYAARLAACADCAALVSGVCIKCGCYPEFRAAFRRQSCPIRNWKPSIKNRKEESL